MSIDPLAQVLDDEFKRVAREEDRPMNDLVHEIATLAGVTSRQLYNYRTGKWPIPARVIPMISRRFRSTALLTVLRDQSQNPDQAIAGGPDLCGNVAEGSME